MLNSHTLTLKFVTRVNKSIIVISSLKTMSSTMLSFVLQNTPPEWEEVDYSESYVLFDLRMFSSEYEDIEKLFRPSLLNIKSIKRVQQPFQYGRFKLRQEMLGRYTLVRIITHVCNNL